MYNHVYLYTLQNCAFDGVAAVGAFELPVDSTPSRPVSAADHKLAMQQRSLNEARDEVRPFRQTNHKIHFVTFLLWLLQVGSLQRRIEACSPHEQVDLHRRLQAAQNILAQREATVIALTEQQFVAAKVAPTNASSAVPSQSYSGLLEARWLHGDSSFYFNFISIL
jgi:hypothetical protein